VTRAVRLEDLPLVVRQRLEVEGTVTLRRKDRRVARGATTWRCHACAATTTVWAQAERHAHGAGHHRIEIVL
jgi:hypothetical protein